MTEGLYTRGALNRLSSQTSGVDPFTGEAVEFGPAAEGGIQSDVAAHQLGLARTLADIARDPNAADRLRGLLGRRVDLFSIMADAEARNKAAREAEEAEESRLDLEEDAVDELGNPISPAERRRRRKARKQRGE